MKNRRINSLVLLLAALFFSARAARSYIVETTVPAAAACPAPNQWNPSPSAPLQLQWSTSLVYPPVIITTAASSQAASNDRLEAAARLD